MSKRKIVKIDADKCTGCGKCISQCAEGAIKIIDGKARLISDSYCDGLGACLGSCPFNAISIEEREAKSFDHQGCPGTKAMQFEDKEGVVSSADQPSSLRQWPIQLHLVSPLASYFQGRDVLLSADCVAYSLGNFHRDYLKGKSLAIACPKLDSNKEVYIEKIKALIDQAQINTLTVMIMEVPCCRGLIQLAKDALAGAGRKIPLKRIVVGLKGNIVSQDWL